jgi:hypothetical protein
MMYWEYLYNYIYMYWEIYWDIMIVIQLGNIVINGL